MDVTLAFIGAILLGLGILLVLAGIGIVRIESDIKVRTGTGTAVAGMFFVVIGILVLFFRFGGSAKLSPEPTPVIELANTPTSVPEVVEVVTLVEEMEEPLPEPTLIVEVAPTMEPTEAPTEEVVEAPVAPTEVVPDTADAVTTLAEEVVGAETAVKLQTTATNIGIFAGPSDVNPRLGLLNFNDELEVLGKVRGSLWYQVEAESGVTGWVDADKVEFISGSDDDVPITWPSASSSDGEQEPVTTTTCMSTAVARNATGTVFIKWSNLPDDARWLYLTIRGELNGEMTDLIQPNNKIDVNDRDTAAKGFELGSYLFNPDDPSSKGFPTGTNFNFTLQAQDAGGNSLCVASGNFQ